MAKGDDVKLRKKNKSHRKKLQNDSSSVSARVAALIAAKKRRQSGKRRRCEGMCFSLPTPEDPFNDRHGKLDLTMNKIKKPLHQLNNKESSKDPGSKQLKKSIVGDQDNPGDQRAKKLKQMELAHVQQKASVDNLADLENSGCPSKFLFTCLNTIQDSLLGDGKLNNKLDDPLFVKSWGFDFWRSYSLGHDILENSGDGPSMQQIAWMASTATDSISQMEKEGIAFNSPFLLYLVSSQERAVKVRLLCKPLKAFGVHTVTLHAGTSVEHQIQGLKSCEPEFLVATPERLWELVSLKAVDISNAFFLVVDGMNSLSNCLDVVESIKKSISGNPRTVVFQGRYSGACAQAVEHILRRPFHRLSLDESLKEQSVQS